MVDLGMNRSADRTVSASDDIRAALRPHSAAVFDHLLVHRGKVVSKHDLMDAVWPDVEVTENSLYQCIAEIRKQLGDDTGFTLSNVPGRGYMLEQIAGNDSARPQGQWIAGAMVLVAGVILVALAMWIVRPEPPFDDGREPSIAVLPFEAVSERDLWVRMGRGLATEVANELARNDWLYVTAPEATWDITAEPPVAARNLNVRFVVSGTIQAEGDQVRVVATLTDAESREVMWSDRWTGERDHLFSIQDAVVSRIGASLASSNSGLLPQTDLRRAKRKPTDRMDAYDHYLLGVELKHTFNPKNYPPAIDHLERAVEIDPEFARGWAILALVNGFLADMNIGLAAEQFKTASIIAAQRAYALDPDDPEVLYNYARAISYLGSTEEGREVLAKAIDVAPNNADILLIVSWIGGQIRMDGPTLLAWADRAFELNPKPPFWYYLGRSEAAFFAGEYAESVASASRGPKSTYRFLFTALSEAMQGNLPQARAAAEELRALAPDFTLAGYFEGVFDQVPKREEIIEAAYLAGIAVTVEDLRAIQTALP